MEISFAELLGSDEQPDRTNIKSRALKLNLAWKVALKWVMVLFSNCGSRT